MKYIKPDDLPGPVKYRPATGKIEDRLLSIASLRVLFKKSSAVKRRRK